MRFPSIRVLLPLALASWPMVTRAQKTAAIAPQQSSGVSHQLALALVASSAYLHDQLAKGPPPGRVEFDGRSLTRLVTDSGAALSPRMAQALGVAIADPVRLDTCKPVHSVPCELGNAQAVLEVSSAVVKGTHATVEIRKYQQGVGSGSAGPLTSTLLRFNLVLVSTGWSVIKFGTASG